MPVAKTLAPLAALAVALAVLPLAQAGDQADPEIADPGDDVEVGGGTNCGLPLPPGCAAGMDFFWHNADLQLVWVNDTADAIVFSMQLRASEGFTADNEGGGPLGTADDFTYTYTFAFALGGVSHTAIATLDDALGVTPGGDASSATAPAGSRILTVTVPKSGLSPVPMAGDVLSGLSLTMHGESANAGIRLDDRAPDANAGPDYVLVAGTAGNGTPDDATQEDLKMPAPALPALVLVVFALVAVLRRRCD